MKEFRIFVEGKGDIRFLQDLIEHSFGHLLIDTAFDTLGAWSGYKAGGALKTSIQENFDNGKSTILILDADHDYPFRKAEILHDFTNFHIPIELFLFPDNKSKGALESLLSAIAVERKIINCFETYEQCIQGYSAPVLKSKIFAYLDALLPEGQKKGDKNDKIQERNRDYKLHHFWNLNHNSVDPLKQFISEACGL